MSKSKQHIFATGEKVRASFSDRKAVVAGQGRPTVKSSQTGQFEEVLDFRSAKILTLI
jgi:hypothetical protein